MEMDSADDRHTRIPTSTPRIWKNWELVAVSIVIIAVILIAVLSIELPSSSGGSCTNTTLSPLINGLYYSGYPSFALILVENSTQCQYTALATPGFRCLTWFDNAPIDLQQDCEPGLPCCCLSTNAAQCAANSLTNNTLYPLFSQNLVCV